MYRTLSEHAGVFGGQMAPLPTDPTDTKLDVLLTGCRLLAAGVLFSAPGTKLEVMPPGRAAGAVF